jgi:hypothetical protein
MFYRCDACKRPSATEDWDKATRRVDPGLQKSNWTIDRAFKDHLVACPLCDFIDTFEFVKKVDIAYVE